MHKKGQFVQKKLVKHPQFSTFCQKCRNLRAFLGVKLKGVGNLASVKHLKNSMSGKDLVDPLDPRGLT